MNRDRDVAKTSPVDDSSRWRKVVFWASVFCWFAVLYGFVWWPILIALSIAGPLLLRGGLSLAADALPHVREGIAYFVVFLVGLCLVAGSAATLLPGLPGSWLANTASGLSLLDKRARRVMLAVEAGNGALAGRLAARGLGTDAPIDNFGRPLLFDATDPELLGTLLDAGLSPDAADGDGRTMLMLTHDAGIAAVLLAADADTEIRDREGRTALFYAAGKEPAFVQSLLDTGADVHAVDHAGLAVADVYPAAGPLRTMLEASAGSLALPAPRDFVAADRGRQDWILSRVESRQSRVSLNPQQLQPGETARLDIRIVNDQPADRLLQVRAVLNGAAYLVSASHDGAAENPGLARISRDLRWPLLTLPANSEGALWVDIVLRRDTGLGDLGADVFFRDVGSPEDTAIGISHSLGEERYSADSGFWLPLILTLLIGMAVIYGIQRWLTAKGTGIGSAGLRGAMLGAVVCAVMVLFIVAGMVDPWIGMEETQCEVLDRRVRLEESTTSVSTPRGGRRSTYTVYGVPELAVRYTAAGEPWVSTGFSANTATRNVSELRNFQIGDTVACWFDPDEPARFTVVRSPGAAAITGLIMSLLCALAFAGIALLLRRSKA